MLITDKVTKNVVAEIKTTLESIARSDGTIEPSLIANLSAALDRPINELDLYQIYRLHDDLREVYKKSPNRWHNLDRLIMLDTLVNILTGM